MFEQLKSDLLLASAKALPPASIGVTATLGVINWGTVVLILTAVWTAWQLYTSIRKWQHYQEDRKRRQRRDASVDLADEDDAGPACP